MMKRRRPGSGGGGGGYGDSRRSSSGNAAAAAPLRKKRSKMSLPARVLFMLACCSFVSHSSCASAIPPGDPAVPVPDDCVSSPFEDGLALLCSLSAINSADEKTNFSVVPNEHTLSLTVRCRQSALSELEPEGFRSLKHLKKLTLDGCHLRSLPARAFWGLSKLASLTVKTRNAGVLSVSSDAFVGLPDLEHLDLGGNYIRRLSPRALCPLPRLQSLNLSRNELGSMGDLGDGNIACLGPSVRSLDLSFNDMSLFAVAGNGFASLTKLQELRLGGNGIAGLRGDVFRTMPELRFVDLSNNRLSAVPEEIFAENPELRRISLSNNTLPFLPGGLFRAQNRSLEVLDLSGNLLPTLSAPLLNNLQALTSLDLSHNELVSIDSASALRDLTELQSLKLSHNKLSRLPVLSLPSLRSLSLSHNDISGRLAPARLFSKLPVLSHLLLDFNQIDELPRQVFANSSHLTVLDLSRNKLQGDIPSAVNSLQSLQSFAISNNNIDGLGKLQLPALWRLQASGNRLTGVNVSQLEGLPALQVLDLSLNRIASIEKGAFDLNQPLQALRLDENKLQRIDRLFHDLPNLTWLNLSANEISVFDYAMVPKTLEWLDLHQNRIAALENYFAVEGDYNLAHIDASFNQITELGPQNIPNEVETLLLNDNKIATLVPYTFFKKSKLKKVDLSVNRLESIDRNALRLSSDPADAASVARQPPKFFLGGNPVRCDCHMAWFKSINSADLSSVLSYPVVADLESIYCQLLYSRERTFVPLVDARTEEFLCAYKTHCFALCHCCDYDACDCEMTCPDNCTCYHDTTWTKNIAECSNSKFHDLPDQLPMDATEIFLDGNNIGELHSHTFIGRKNLKVLFLNNSLLTSVENHTFNGLSVLEELHLEGNSISKLQGDEFHGLTLLRELFLHNNEIKTVNNATFQGLKSLQILFLHGNRIADFPVWQLSMNPALTQIQLSENPWSCECRFVEDYRQWLSRSAGKVLDADSITCHFGSSSNEAALTVHRVLDRNVSASCLEASATTRQIQQKDLSLLSSGPAGSSIFHEFLPIFLGVLSGIILIVVLLIAAFIYRDEMRIWLYSKYGIRFFHRIDGMADDIDKIFDAFVTYSAKDDVFVRQVLAPELELDRSSQQYKLCLFYRDLPTHQQHHSAYHLADTIVQATEASRRTLVVLSEHFLKSEWSRFDFKSGLHQALRSGGRRGKQLIVILLGDVASRRDLDPDLRLYLKTAIVLQWGDKLFWEKLRYALPDVQCSRLLPYSHHMSAFSPDTESFRYETYPHAPPRASASATTMTATVASSGTFSGAGGASSSKANRSRSVGGGSNCTYQSVGTPDEQDSTRTMTIHI